jgi:uncharacterized membrane protein YbhN (UPF0104 family)
MQEVDVAPNGRRRQRNWLGWGLALFILAACAWFLDLDRVATILGRIHPAVVLGLLLLLTFDRFLMAWKWALLLRVVGVRLPLMLVTRFYYQGSLTGLFLPSSIGGDLLRATWVAQASGVKHGAFASLLMEKLIGLVCGVIWAIFGAVVLAVHFHGELTSLWLALGAAALGAMAGGSALSLHPAVHGIVLAGLGRFKDWRLLGLAYRLYETYALFSGAKRLLAGNVLLTLAEQALQMMVVLLLTRSLGIAVEPLLLFAMIGVQFLLLRFPISPDGWGVAELSAIGLYGLLGIDSEAAFSMMFLLHILITATCLPGLWFLLQRRSSPSAA